MVQDVGRLNSQVMLIRSLMRNVRVNDVIQADRLAR
jgi:hypothetical protein